MRWLKFLLKLSISLIALYFVFTKIEWATVWQTIKQVSPLWLTSAIIFFILSKWISTYRLQVFWQSAGVHISDNLNIKLYLLGMYYNLFLPGGIGGDGYKVYLLNKSHQVGVKPLFHAVLLDRLNGLLALFCLMVVFFFFTPKVFPLKIFSLLLVPLALVTFYYMLKWLFKAFVGSFAKTTLYSFGVQTAQVIAALSLLLALDSTHQMISYLALFLASSIMAALPITVGGAGARELTFLHGAVFLGLEENIAVAVSILFYGITAVVSLGGIYFSFNTEAFEVREGV